MIRLDQVSYATKVKGIKQHIRYLVYIQGQRFCAACRNSPEEHCGEPYKRVYTCFFENEYGVRSTVYVLSIFSPVFFLA